MFNDAVNITSPWKAISFVPLESTVHMSCTFEELEMVNVRWEIRLFDRTDYEDFSFNKDLLHNRGFYLQSELDFVLSGSKTIHLGINNTSVMNNQTLIRCRRSNSNRHEMSKLIMYGKPRLMLWEFVTVCHVCIPGVYYIPKWNHAYHPYIQDLIAYS